MKGSGFLKVTGILMIIGGGLGILLSIIAIAGMALLISAGVSAGLMYVSIILFIISSVIELIAGIKGVKHCNDPVEGGKCLIWGILVVALAVISLILTLAAGGKFSFWSFLVGLVVPVLYIIGAVQIKKN